MSTFRGPPLQIIETTGPTNPHPLDPAELSERVVWGPPLQMLDTVEANSPVDLLVGVQPADRKLVHDIIARLGPDAVQQILDDYRRTAARAG